MSKVQIWLHECQQILAKNENPRAMFMGKHQSITNCFAYVPGENECSAGNTPVFDFK